MTSDSKENLLKILVNEEEEQQKATSSNFEILEKITTDWQPPIRIIPYNNYEIVLMADRKIGVFNKNNELILNEFIKIRGSNASADTITIDDNGNLYAMATSSADNKTYLVYLNNVTEKTEGEYKLVTKKFYDLSNFDTEIPYTMKYSYRTILEKGPLDSRFLILFSGNATNSNYKNITAIEYHVNFEGTNDYRYKQTRYTYDSTCTNLLPIGLKAQWTEEDVDVTLVCGNDSANYGSYYAGSTNIMLCRFNFSQSGFNFSRLLHVDNFVSYGMYSPISAFMSSNEFYFAYCQKSTTNNSYTTTICYYNGTLQQIYRVEGHNTREGVIILDTTIMLKVNNLVFVNIGVKNATPERHVQTTIFLHLIGNQAKEFVLEEDVVNVSENLLIFNDFDIYYILANNIKCRYIYVQDSYNNEPYFSKTSITSRNSTLYDNNDNPIFSRKLYNKYIVGNSITSITQVPYNYLNDETIAKEELISMNNSVIDSEQKEIEKNVYEELMINNIDSYKIFDNNNGSSYLQKPSLELTKNIFNGFENNFKITNYRINYSDNTHKDEPIRTIQRNGNIATIYLYIYVDKQIDNIQLYDSNYTTPFITIKPNLELNKLYVITQKVKVE